MSMIYDTTTTYTYWKVGTGNPFDAGGYCGFDSVTTAADGTVVGRVQTKPAGADDLTEAQWDALQAQIIADGDQVVVGGDEWLAEQKAEEEATLLGARTNLEAGDPLTAEQASLLTRGL